jgi:hypothetical protein
MAKLKLATLDSPSSREKGEKGSEGWRQRGRHNSSPTTITHQPDLDDDDQGRKPGLGFAQMGQHERAGPKFTNRARGHGPSSLPLADRGSEAESDRETKLGA